MGQCLRASNLYSRGSSEDSVSYSDGFALLEWMLFAVGVHTMARSRVSHVPLEERPCFCFLAGHSCIVFPSLSSAAEQIQTRNEFICDPSLHVSFLEKPAVAFKNIVEFVHTLYPNRSCPS